MKILTYLYYRVYQFHLSFAKESDTPELKAKYTIGILFLANLLELNFIVAPVNELIRPLPYAKPFNALYLFGLLIMIIINIINTYLFTYKGKYKKIIAYWKHNESIVHRRIGTLLVLIYIFLSIGVPLLYVFSLK